MTKRTLDPEFRGLIDLQAFKALGLGLGLANLTLTLTLTLTPTLTLTLTLTRYASRRGVPVERRSPLVEYAHAL